MMRKPPARRVPYSFLPKGWVVASVLALVLVLAAVLRLVNLGQSPPGLNQDEAANAWNAYCLLKTGQDQIGVRWPIFFCHALGGNRTTLHLYVLMPFQALGGLNVYTTRLPSAVGGIVTVLLVYLVGARLFGRPAGLVAAALLAIDPWHLQQSRWGHEAALCPLLVAATLAAMLWANLPLDDDEKRRPRPGPAALAGVLAGVSCYGYGALRLFLPAFLALAVGLTWRAWWNRLKTSRGALAVTLFAAGLAVTLGPLAFKHVSEPAGVAKRAQVGWIWKPSDTAGARMKTVLARYAQHFAPEFLFVHGDHYEAQSPPDMGQLHWYMLPLMVLGLVVATRRAWSSRAARVLLAWVIVYPIGDCLTPHMGVSLHALRTLPGLCGLILLAAVGGVSTAAWLWRRDRAATVAVVGSLAISVVALNVPYLYVFFGQYNRRPSIYHAYHVDLLEACAWLGPRFDQADAVVCTTDGMNQPYVIMLVALGYDPNQWFRDERVYRSDGLWDHYSRCGKMHFARGADPPRAVTELMQNARRDRVVFIARPDEFGLKHPDHLIRRPDGEVVLWILEQYL